MSYGLRGGFSLSNGNHDEKGRFASAGSFPRPDYWDASRQPSNDELQYHEELTNAETPKDASKVKKAWTKKIDSGETEMSDGSLLHVHKAHVERLKQLNETPRSHGEARADSILRTRDSMGKATARRLT